MNLIPINFLRMPSPLPLRYIHTPWSVAGFCLLLCCIVSLNAHHFKGLPHYNYFENYPQVPEEEFLGQAGSYEFSLVVYDFQGINKEKVETPENVRLFLLVFSLLENKVYTGPMTLEVLNNEKTVKKFRFESADLENIYSVHHELPDTGRYRLNVILHQEGNLTCEIPFKLSSQKTHWGKWIALSLLLLISVTAAGARKARIKQDRVDAANLKRKEADNDITPSPTNTLGPPA
jgi:hypothetical protein